MRTIDQGGLLLCRLQGNLFEASATQYPTSSAIFIRRFMNSSVARRIDRESYLGGFDSTASILAELDQEYGTSAYGCAKFDTETLYWIGYLYRYWAYTHEQPSAALFKIISGRELAQLYPAYHSLDPSSAIDRILEARGLSEKPDLISQGVEALRRIRNEGRYVYAVVRLPKM